MFVAVVLAALAATPAPAASPLKEIIRVTTRPLCSALKDRIGPSVAALLENDATSRDGTWQIYEMGRDSGRPWLQIDKLHLENDVSRIVRNLETADRLLRAAEDEAAKNGGADRKTIETLTSKLRAVADAQRAQLNTLDGTLETEQMAELMGSDLPIALTTSGFNVSRLGGGEIASDAAGYAEATPGPSASDASRSAAPPPQPLAGTARLAPAAATQGVPRNAYIVVGERGLPDLQSELNFEKAFTRSLVPAAAQCQRLISPPKP